MNIFLVPYNWTRHVAVALVVGGASLLAWWMFLHVRVWLGPTLHDWGVLWTPGAEGPLFLGLIAGTIAAASVLAEQALRRAGLLRRIGLPMLAGFATMLLAILGYWIFYGLTYLFAGSEMREVVADPSLTSHRHHLWMWLAAGVSSGLGPLIVRRGRGFFAHVFGALVAAGAGAALWQYLGYHAAGDLYLGAGLGVFLWGTLHGLLVWGIPSELYGGWVRVLSPYRYGYRVPIDRPDGAPAERFVGHFPRGLDLFLPVDDGVAELHTSFVVDTQHHYTVRGLSQQPTTVRRFLERIDLRYDPRRPAPLETELHMEDRILMGEGERRCEVEFLLLPKEER